MKIRQRDERRSIASHQAFAAIAKTHKEEANLNASEQGH